MVHTETPLPRLALLAVVAFAVALLGDMILPRSGHALVLCVKQTKNPSKPKAFFRANKCPGVAEGQPVSTDGSIQQFVLPGAFTCWDKNQNGRCDKETEDTNGVDGCTNADCGGTQCWDLNGNLTCDPDEDRNGKDGCNADDCKGVECWDRNRNGDCDAGENIDGSTDGCTVADCRAPECWDENKNLRCDVEENIDGSLDGCQFADCKTPECWDKNEDLRCGADENIDGSLDGCQFADCKAPECWDKNKNLRCDANDDVDGLPGCTISDCTGPKGPAGTDGANGMDGVNGTDGIDGLDGANGADGEDGADGANGLPCWDLDTSGVCDGAEDVNGGGCDASDCLGDEGPQGLQGPQGGQGPEGLAGADGIPCWDLDASGFCDGNEDLNGNGCDASDCQGESEATAAEGEEGPIPDVGTGGLKSLPAGSYMLLAKGTLTNGTPSPINVDCDLLGDSDAILDTTTVDVPPSERVVATVQATATITGGTVRLRCAGGQDGDITMAQIAVNAILVGKATNAVCGDGSVNRFQEECDDGDTDGGDGCSNTCQNEGGG